ncbi:hypothetical protein AC477_00990 [miscellaneous Crenarchaeota group-1 archaeon SG8-32-1]|uniref:FUN14 family protein n=1 Tax=miscellaneous Crenarchaeota group-1 archaeon SG8-32-1 TaxID=1685124 RepID=A0A0M0C0L4_9ARCH|nr:MAG: hypothetical protein AC477_00990 [miscellaneous Crenarchaeota group-1 archaeon SG8-32-1]
MTGSIGSEPFTAILFQLVIGGIGGFLIGLTLRKIAKVALIIAVVVFALIFLAYINVVDVDYNGLFDIASRLVETFNPALNLIIPLLTHLPFIVSLCFGIFIGVRKVD